jgi:phosphoenolpyruvate carboxykinase (GTP)
MSTSGATTTSTGSPPSHARLRAWAHDIARLTLPEHIHWCDDSPEEYHRLCQDLVAAGTFEKLSDAKRPNSYVAFSDQGDVPRVEDRTFICSQREEDAGPTNHWREPQAMRERLTDLFRGSMQGRTLYVVPFCMGPLHSDKSYVGGQITDSAYVARAPSGQGAPGEVRRHTTGRRPL